MDVARFDAGPQPAGRRPAPGRLGYVQAWVNTFWDLEGGGGDGWTTPGALRAWLAARGFTGARPGATELAQAIEVREALRAILLGHHDDVAEPPAALATLDAAGARHGPGAGLRPRFDAAGAWLDTPGVGLDAAVGLLLAVVVEARADGTWLRLKACPHAHCGWAFYDHSRNRGGQWCSMRICGNRTKSERFRERRRRNLQESPVYVDDPGVTRR